MRQISIQGETKREKATKNFSLIKGNVLFANPYPFGKHVNINK